MSNTMSSSIHPIDTPQKTTNSRFEGVFGWAQKSGLEEIHFKCDSTSGLQAIIAIHHSGRGPALGGTRCICYENEFQALQDVMRLAQGMSYKSAFANLPFGGGKAVLIAPERINDRNVYFEAYGQFIESLNGRFITAVDVGTSATDMDIINRKTRYVLGTNSGTGDPSIHTALGVFKGIQAAVKVKLGKDSLDRLSVAIQGLGKVGYALAQLLHDQGCRLLVSDLDTKKMLVCAKQFGAEMLAGGKILSTGCDILCPCAMGSVFNYQTIDSVKAKIICGAANNQLFDESCGDRLATRDIAYTPDYVVNVGGLIHVIYGSGAECNRRIDSIYKSVLDIFEHARTRKLASHRIADQIAKKLLENKTESSISS